MPTERAANVRAPALVMSGSAAYPFMLETARALSQVIPHAQFRALEGQKHDVSTEVYRQYLRSSLRTSSRSESN